MPGTVTLFSDSNAFAPLWRPALEQLGLTVRESAPEELAGAVDGSGAVVVDAASQAYDEDELLAAIGFVRAAGAVPIVHLPDDGAMRDVEDVLDEMCVGLVARATGDVARLATSLARRLDRGRARRFEFVTISPREGEVLAILGDGNSVLLKRPVGADDDGSDIVAIELADDATEATLGLATGATVSLHANNIAPTSNSNGHGGVIPIDGARLGARLRELRLEAGLTQAELARRTGIHRPNIARVEAGRHTPSLETLSRLATAIGVPTTRVLSED